MDELTLLREHAPPVEPPSHEILDAARSALRERMDRPVRARPRRPRWLVAAAAAAGLAAVATVGALLWQPGGGPAPAYAEWTPTPGPVDPALQGQVRDRCAGLYQGFVDATRDDPTSKTWPQTMPPLVAVDQRGDAGIAYFADDTVFLVCHLTREQDGWEMASGGGGRFDEPAGAVDDEPFDPARDAITIDSHQGWWNQGTAITSVVGRVGDGVDSVVIHLENGVRLAPTLEDGAFFAWWPSGSQVREAVAFDASGEELGSARPEVTTAVIRP